MEGRKTDLKTKTMVQMSVGQMSVVHLPLEHNSRHLKMTKIKI